MFQTAAIRRSAAAALLATLSLALASCLLSPGKFTSELAIRKDRSFSFSYAGEIHLLALSKLADMGADGAFKPEPCTVAGSSTERSCTQREIGEQKRKWQESRAAGADKRKRDADTMKAMLGGIDPSDPRAAEELAQRLRRQAGWRQVNYKGDGLFDVDFAISGKLDHDFTFPTIERFPMANAFVQVAVRNDGTVRVDAPGYAAAMTGEPWRSMMAGAAAGAGAAAAEGRASAPPFPVIDGRFTVITDGSILANNTEDGPQPSTTGQNLEWIITPRSAAPPMALVRLAR